ncbi:AIPR family protein [Photobacterium leiognathi]|uniref:AIPR family protein n=1 Tax=Photobacterium leiognathi TaxID=553611 RepID=UPI0027340E72|nr:AIPR family protein [Photobacterium leiognathi]
MECQTLRTIHHFNSISSDNMEEYLSEAEVLVRFFVAENDDYKNKIAEYTNSQNAISSIDLKSLSSEQILIEQYLDINNIIYARKSGDIGKS